MMGLQIGVPVAQANRGPAAGSRAAHTQASPPNSLPVDGTSSQHAKSDSSATKAEAESSRLADRSASASSTQAAQASNATRREAAPVDADRDADTHEDFATVLASSGPADTSTAAPLPTAGADDHVDDAASPPAELSEQFLTLLSGTWALPTEATGTSARAEPSAAETGYPVSLSAALTPANPPAATSSLLATAVAPTQIGNAIPDALPSTGVAGSLASLRAAITPAAEPPLTATVTAPTPKSEPLETLATLAANSIPAAGRDSLKQGADGAAPMDGLSVDSAPLAITAPVPLRVPLSALALPAPLALPADPDAGFDDGFGSRIAWMAEQRLGHAQIRLNPEHVGPIEVRVQLDGDRVSAQFNSMHAEVRQAIEASLPRLREMLGEHGLQLGQADVGNGGASRGEDQGNSQRGDTPNGSKDGLQLAPTTFVGTRRLLDEYA